MGARKLAYTVSVQNADGDIHTFGPNDEVPAWAEKAIVNPGAWEDGGAGAPDQGDDDSAADGDMPSAIPPKGGAGSGAENWRDYARSKDVEVADDASRDDVIAALEAAGLATE